MQRDPASQSQVISVTGVPFGNDPINKVDPSGLTQQQAWQYFNSLPADVNGALQTILAVQFGGAIPTSTGFSLIAADEPYRQYLDQMVAIANQPLDAAALAGRALT